MKQLVDGFPRRQRIDLMVPAELAIRNAILEVECVGAHQLLTEAVIMLGEAKDKVSDFLDTPSLHASQYHICHCGTATHAPHEVGKLGCVRRMTEAPEQRPNDRWLVDGSEVTEFTLMQQRGYYRHPCGCWSRSPGSENSIKA